MKRRLLQESGRVLKTFLAVLLLLGATGFVVYSLVENGLLGGVPETGTAPITSQVVPPPPVDFEGIHANWRRFPEYARQIEDETARIYDQRNAKTEPWFEDGRTAVRLMAGIAAVGDRYGEGLYQTANAYAKKAYQRGCRDPLVVGIRDAYFFKKSYSKDMNNATDHLDNIKKLAESDYPAVVKLDVEAAGLDNLTYIYRKKIEGSLAARERLPELYEAVLGSFRELIHSNPPDGIVYFKLGDLYDALQDDPATLVKFGDATRSILRESKVSPAIQAACHGDFLTTLAWGYRGSGWASSVTEDGHNKMMETLIEADQVLTAAAAKYPDEVRIPTLMLTVELGQGMGKDRMNKWFDSATGIDPDYFRAYSAKANYLQPKWYGSPQEVMEFGWQCVQTGKWDQVIPMIFVENIAEISDQAPKIYENKKVWDAVQQTYEEYLKRYPRSTCYRTMYLNAAAQARQWKVAREQLGILGDHWHRWTLSDKRMNEIRQQLAASES